MLINIEKQAPELCRSFPGGMFADFGKAAFGRLEVVEDAEKALAFVRQMSAKFTDDTDYIEREIAQAMDHTLFFTLTPEHITGKLVNEA